MCQRDSHNKYFSDANGEHELTTIVDPATGHSYSEPVWQWSEDLTSATATLVCAEGDDTQTIDATVTTVTTAPTVIADGKIDYTAKVTLNGKNYTDTKSMEMICPLKQFNSSTETNPTLTLTEDVTGNLTIIRPDGVIDLNGHTLDGNVFLQNNDPDKTITIKNGTIKGELDGAPAWADFFKGKIVLDFGGSGGSDYHIP